MSLTFDGSGHQYVGCSAGTIGATGTGAYTMVALYRPTSNPYAALVSLMSGSLAGGTQERQIIEDTGALYGTGDFSSGFGSIAGDTWYLVGQSKAAGSNVYRWHVWPYASDGSGTKTHGDGTGTHGDGSTVVGIRIGDGDNYGLGDIALVAIWKRVLSDADFNNLCGNTAQAFISLGTGGADALLLCNVASPSSIVDATGNGANYSATSGSNITIGSDPPSFNFSVGGSNTVTSAPHSLPARYNFNRTQQYPQLSFAHLLRL
jgi:hypothetical protein